jgi:hypothetical protein
VRRALLLLGLAACPGGETRVFSAEYTVRGNVRGARAMDDTSGGRVTCTVDVDPRDPLDPTPVFTLAVVSAVDGRRQAGLYFTIRDFRGQGGYTLGTGMDRGQVTLFDRATLADCVRPGDTTCYGASDGCFLLLESWILGEALPPGVRTGTATGRIACSRMTNPLVEGRVELVEGSFSCRASDWTATRR